MGANWLRGKKRQSEKEQNGAIPHWNSVQERVFKPIPFTPTPGIDKAFLGTLKAKMTTQS